MLYLIMIGSAFVFLLTCLVFFFVPIFKIDKIPISYLVGTSAEYNYSVLDVLDQPKALVSFILAILSVILVLILLIKAFKVYDAGIYSQSIGDYIFSSATTTLVLAYTIFVFLFFTSNAEVNTTEGLYAYYKNHLATFILLVIFSAVALLCNVFAFVIKTLNMFVPSVAQKKIFKMIGNKKTETIIKNTTIIDKIKSDESEKTKTIDTLKVKELKELLEMGAITQEEYDIKKKE